MDKFCYCTVMILHDNSNGIKIFLEHLGSAAKIISFAADKHMPEDEKRYYQDQDESCNDCCSDKDVPYRCEG